MTTFMFQPSFSGYPIIQPFGKYEPAKKLPGHHEKGVHKVYSDGSIHSMADRSGKNYLSRTSSFDENDDLGSYGYYSSQKDNLSVSSVSTNSSYSTITPIKAPKGKKKAKEIDFIVNFKTEMCRHWEEHGYCQFGPKCAFAHGEQELRQKVNVLNGYKAKKCVHFHTEAFCPYGKRCQFLHSLHVLGKDRFSYVEKMNDPTLLEEQQFECICKTRPRLPIFKEITQHEKTCEHFVCDAE